MHSVLLFSDLHCHSHKAPIFGDKRLYHCLEALEWVFQTAQDRKIQNVIFAGDLFQERQKIDTLTYHLTFKKLQKYCTKSINLWLLLGNHDMWFYDKWDINSIEPFSAIDGVTVVSDPCTLEILGHEVDFCPYTHDPINHLKNLAEKKRKTRKTLIAHLAVDGAKLNTLHNTKAEVVIEHDGEMTKVTPDNFKYWDKVWLGHYHGQQKIDSKIEYIGSPLQLNFGEAFQHKHIIVYNLENGDTEYIRNKFSPQHFIIPESDINKYDIENNFIRIEAEDNIDLLKVKKDIQQLSPGSLEIIPIAKKDSEHVITDAKAILYKEEEMIESYTNQVEDLGDLEKSHLVEVGKIVYKKAIIDA